MRIKESFGDGLTIWKFYNGDKIVGQMKISFYESNVNIFSIESYEKGYGTKMVNSLKLLEDIETIDGDVSEGTDQFWLSVGGTIEDDVFLINC